MKQIIILLWISLIPCLETRNKNSLQVISTVYSSVFPYRNYASIKFFHFDIPKETAFTSFKFERIENFNQTLAKLSPPNCSTNNISLVLKHGSLPLILTPNTQFPPNVRYVHRSSQMLIHLMSGQDQTYANFTWPTPGSYFLTAFVTEQSQTCGPVNLKTTLSVQKWSIIQIVEKICYKISLPAYHRTRLKFFVPEKVKYATFIFTNLTSPWIIRIQSRRPPSRSKRSSFSNPSNTTFSMPFTTEEHTWHFIELTFANAITTRFTLKYSQQSNASEFFDDFRIDSVLRYREFELFKESYGEILQFSYRLRRDDVIDATNDELVALKFELKQVVDVGGTLHISLSSDSTIVGCLHPGVPALPTRFGACRHGMAESKAQLFLNETTANSSIVVPYPEPGRWYVTFRLFCEECPPCVCPRQCQRDFEECMEECRKKCVDQGSCNVCPYDCKMGIIARETCQRCNCDGPCLRQDRICGAKVSFNVSSMPCIDKCGTRGLCHLVIDDGVTFGICKCAQNRRGWSCWDSSAVPPSHFISVLELLLLVLSNLPFLLPVCVAYRRRYRVEAIAYFSVFIFSTLYHACDADTVNRPVQYCITAWQALQFADFNSAISAIWVTLIAIADLPSHWAAVCYVAGSLVFSFLVVVSATAVWVSAAAPAAGAALVAGSWLLKWRRMGRRFVDKTYVFLYVPLGVGSVSLGLLFFNILVTNGNYIYLHSLWHVLMALAVVVVLPRKDTFRKEVKDRGVFEVAPG